MALRGLLAAILIAVTCACGEAKAPAKEAPLTIGFAVETMTLSNGLTVLLHRDPAAQSVAIRIRYFVGAKDDPRDRVGIAHLYEHLMFAGTARTSPRDFHAYLESIGGFESNGATSLDHTDYYESVPPEMIGRALWLEADRMASLLANIDDARLAREKSVVGNEERERTDHAYYTAYDVAFPHVFGPAHPYSVEKRDRNAGVARTTLEDLHAFGRRRYRPDNAVLVIAGDFDSATARDLATRAFGGVPAGPPIERKLVAPEAPVAKDITIRDPAGPARIILAWVAPGEGSDGYDELLLGADVIRSALTQDLRSKRDLVTNVDASLLGGRLASVLSISLTPRNPGDRPRILAIVKDDLVEIRTNVGRWEGFEPIRLEIVSHEALSFAGISSRADRIADAFEIDGKPAMATARLVHLQTILSEDVGTALQHFVIDRPHVTLDIRP